MPTLAILATMGWTFTASAVELEVGADQAVTLSGESPSLRSVVEELCDRAGIELRGYDAPDREFHGSYHDVPATGLLQRLLRDESHVVGLKTDATHHTRIAWLRVLGDAGPAVAPPRPIAVSSVPTPTHTVAPQMPAQAFAGQKERMLDLVQPIFEADAPDREAKIAEVAKMLSEDESAREALLGAGETDIAEQLVEYPGAARTLGQLSAALTNAGARKHLATITQRVVAMMRERAAERGLNAPM